MAKGKTVELIAEVHRKGYAFCDEYDLNEESWVALRALQRRGEVEIRGGYFLRHNVTSTTSTGNYVAEVTGCTFTAH